MTPKISSFSYISAMSSTVRPPWAPKYEFIASDAAEVPDPGGPGT
jgi:hypothetical protein